MRFEGRTFALIIIFICSPIWAFLVPFGWDSFWDNYIYEHSGFKVTINNNTNQLIEGLKIRCANSLDGDFIVPPIPLKQSFSTRIFPKLSGEGSMWIEYTDKEGKTHQEGLFGYFEQGYSGQVSVKINSITDNRIIQFKTESKTNLTIFDDLLFWKY